MLGQGQGFRIDFPAEALGQLSAGRQHSRHPIAAAQLFEAFTGIAAEEALRSC